MKPFINYFWDNAILPTLKEYIHIPNKSPHFDSAWQQNGYMKQASDLLVDWCKKYSPPDFIIETIELTNRTPIIFIDIPGDNNETILLYGHFDKQPEMTGWDKDLHPWKAVLKEDRLYGRGSADDGYAIFASLAAILSLKEQKISHARCVILIESCEESGSYDLPYYIQALQHRIGNPNFIICLDSGCGNYQQLWVTTSLRGLTNGTLSIEVLSQGIHSGKGSGIVPGGFQILRQLLSRIEKETTGEILLKDLYVPIPPARLEQARHAAEILGDDIHQSLHLQAKPLTTKAFDLILNHTWRPALAIIGCDGIPAIQDAGNVILPKIEFKLSLRLPPTCHAEKAARLLKTTLESHPPYQAKIHYEISDTASGWNALETSPWLTEAINNASLTYFNHPAAYMGEGGSIPFMGMLGQQFPEAQFLITGLLGPESNAHGPNEFLHIPTAKKLTHCISDVIKDHFKRYIMKGKV